MSRIIQPDEVCKTDAAAFREFASTYRCVLDGCYARADCERWGVPIEHFDSMLYRSASAVFGRLTVASRPMVVAYLGSLHLTDLALACACQHGVDVAWEYFVSTYHRRIQLAVRALARDRLDADMADSLYAELYGIRRRGEARVPLIARYHGKSSLMTWIRGVLRRRYAASRRMRCRTVPLEAASDGIGSVAAPIPEFHAQRYRRLAIAAFGDALRALPALSRARFYLYHRDKLTLAAVGKLLQEHEATSSRQLAATRRKLISTVLKTLEAHALDPDEIRLCTGYLQEPMLFDIALRWSQVGQVVSVAVEVH
jgi:DNA-directed RNA polymerase specialized sigma24 family protein